MSKIDNYINYRENEYIYVVGIEKYFLNVRTILLRSRL